MSKQPKHPETTARRQRAISLHIQGRTRKEIADELGVSPVNNWQVSVSRLASAHQQASHHQDVYMLALSRAGYSIEEIAPIMGLGPVRVLETFHDSGLIPRKRNSSFEGRRGEAIALSRRGFRLRQIADRMGRGINTVRRYLPKPPKWADPQAVQVRALFEHGQSVEAISRRLRLHPEVVKIALRIAYQNEPTGDEE